MKEVQIPIVCVYLGRNLQLNIKCVYRCDKELLSLCALRQNSSFILSTAPY